MNSGGPEEHYTGVSAIVADFWQIFANSENIPSESAGAHLFKQEGLFSTIWYIVKFIN